MNELPRHNQDQIEEYRGKIARYGKEAEKYVDEFGYYADPVFGGLSPEELIELGYSILASPSVKDAYNLLSLTPEDEDRNYYERIFGLIQHGEAWELLFETITSSEPEIVDRALDVGTGTGVGSVFLSLRAKHVVGIDLSEGMLEVTKRRLERAKELYPAEIVSTLVMDAKTLAFASGSFDIAMSHAVSPYLSLREQVEMYYEIYRVLKPGGRYYEQFQDGQARELYTLSPMGKLAQAVANSVLLLRQKDSEGHFAALQDIGFDVQWNDYTSASALVQSRSVAIAKKPG